jgi:hypothetical protein
MTLLNPATRLDPELVQSTSSQPISVNPNDRGVHLHYTLTQCRFIITTQEAKK